jgi:hypothetical protein
MILRMTGLAATILLLAGAARADELIDITVTGTVDSQEGSVSTIGDTITASLVYDATSGLYESFSIDGYGLPVGGDAHFGASTYHMVYKDNLSAVQDGGTQNVSLALALYPLVSFSATDIADYGTDLSLSAFYVDPTDPANSSGFEYYADDIDGNNIVYVDALLTSYSAVIPEPASALVLAPALAWLAGRKRWGGRAVPPNPPVAI